MVRVEFHLYKPSFIVKYTYKHIKWLTGIAFTVISTHRFRESSSYQPRLTASSAILKPIFAKKLLQLGDFALQQQWFFHVIPMETLTGYNLT